MSSFNRDPRELISVADARDLIIGRRRSAYFRSRIEIFPRPSRALRRLRRRWAEIATVGFGVAWLALPRGSTLGLVFLLAGVAAGRAAVGKWRRDGNERN